ncbi:MAG TPA: tetratricopeptide repeat protein [Bacteroidia bacterium]|nr:tetratricopeptide repeat protein [Bacteroidia bacterium]
MIKKVFFSLLLLYQSILFAQSGKVLDSLKNTLKTEKSDSNKVNTLNALCKKLYKSGSYDTSFIYATRALTLAKQLDYKKGIATAFLNSGIVYWYLFNFQKALEYDSTALVAFKEIGDKPLMANCLSNIGNIYVEHGNYSKALECFIKALALCEETGNKYLTANNLKYIGSVYTDQGNYSKALEYDLKALGIYETLGNKPGTAADLSNIGIIYDGMANYSKSLEYHLKALAIDSELQDKSGIAADYSEIGIIYHETKKYPQALVYDFKALAIENELQDKQGIGNSLGNIGNIYTDQGDFQEGLDYNIKAIAINRELGNNNDIAINFCNIGNINTKLKNYKQAQADLDSALRISKKIGDKDIIKNIYSALATLDSVEGNYIAGLENFKKFISYRDSLVNEANTKKTVQTEMNFEFEQKQATEKAEQDKKDAVAEQGRKRQLVIRNSFIAGFALMLALAFFIFRGYRQKQKDNEIISTQKAIVEEKQKEILDSIKYAQRIQNALLASDKLLSKNLPEYFVLFKPKDIVSGDFYWATAKGDKFYLAICDSTGHGVPGAFMSLLNISFLNEAISEKGIKEPNEVFNHARKKLIENVSYDGGKDGMDGSLLCISGFNLSYGSAYNAPLVIRKGEAIELNTDKMPVGSSPRENESFTLNTFTLQKGDMLYTFTDGYADQFGGPKGKKYKYKQLQQLLMDYAQLTMKEQKEFLNKAFESWKGTLEQVDDVLIIGIRV